MTKYIAAVLVGVLAAISISAGADLPSGIAIGLALSESNSKSVVDRIEALERRVAALERKK